MIEHTIDSAADEPDRPRDRRRADAAVLGTTASRVSLFDDRDLQYRDRRSAALRVVAVGRSERSRYRPGRGVRPCRIDHGMSGVTENARESGDASLVS